MLDIRTRVIHIAVGREALIVASKENPKRTNNDPLGRNEIYPDSGYDYLIYYYDKTNPETGEITYRGSQSVMENEISILG